MTDSEPSFNYLWVFPESYELLQIDPVHNEPLVKLTDEGRARVDHAAQTLLWRYSELFSESGDYLRPGQPLPRYKVLIPGFQMPSDSYHASFSLAGLYANGLRDRFSELVSNHETRGLSFLRDLPPQVIELISVHYGPSDRDTIGNVCALLDSTLEQYRFDQVPPREITVISSDTHMPRVDLLTRTALGSYEDFEQVRLGFLPVQTKDIIGVDAWQERVVGETRKLASLFSDIARYEDFPSLLRYWHRTHDFIDEQAFPSLVKGLG